MTRSLNIRPAVREDAAQILDFIRQLAIYEKAEHEVLASEDDILRHVLQDDAVASALICERHGVAIGFAVYFFSYSTWLGKPGLFLEDLFVLPEHRGDFAHAAMRKWTFATSDQVARRTLDALDRKQLYVVPQFDGRFMWRFKRYAPRLYARALGEAYRLAGG